ncbi:MAG: hypothetical protein R3301_02430 [Saprospiraceae bacterium]|nr:hypothetical protein [Saprospiraceae bacterium]
MRVLFSILFAGLLVLPACGKREVPITGDLRRTIDTVAARQINLLRPELDSLCRVWFDSLVAEAADSILEVRTLERQSLIGQ